jgi:hypothetical protein
MPSERQTSAPFGSARPVIRTSNSRSCMRANPIPGDFPHGHRLSGAWVPFGTERSSNTPASAGSDPMMASGRARLSATWQRPVTASGVSGRRRLETKTARGWACGATGQTGASSHKRACPAKAEEPGSGTRRARHGKARSCDTSDRGSLKGSRCVGKNHIRVGFIPSYAGHCVSDPGWPPGETPA